MAKEVTTIYIDDSAVWALVVRGRRPLKWAAVSLEPGLVKGGVILNGDALAAKVRELWKTKGIGARRVIAGISGINCLHRLLILPELPKNLLPEAVRREAGRVLGVPLEGLYISWQTLPSMRGETVVYLAASPRNSVDVLILTLRKAGLNPYLMDLRPLALARATTESRAIIIDVQPTNFDIVVMAERMPEVLRSVPLPLEDSLEEKMPLIKEELDRAITFYNSSHKDKPIEATVPLLVCGEIADREDAWERLAGRQKQPVQALPSPVETVEGFPASQYMTNIGLALKRVLASKKEATAYSLVSFNALPEVYIPKPRPISEILLMPVLIAGIALVALGVYVNITASAYTSELHAEWANINQIAVGKGAEVRTQAEEIATAKQQVSSLDETANALATTLGGFAAGRDEINGDLGQINKLLATIDLLSVSDDTQTITVAGLADDENAVFRYAKNLRASRRFALVVITNMYQVEHQIGFALRLTK